MTSPPHLVDDFYTQLKSFPAGEWVDFEHLSQRCVNRPLWKKARSWLSPHYRALQPDLNVLLRYDHGRVSLLWTPGGINAQYQLVITG